MLTDVDIGIIKTLWELDCFSLEVALGREMTESELLREFEKKTGFKRSQFYEKLKKLEDIGWVESKESGGVTYVWLNKGKMDVLTIVLKYENDFMSALKIFAKTPPEVVEILRKETEENRKVIEDLVKKYDRLQKILEMKKLSPEEIEQMHREIEEAKEKLMEFLKR